MAIESTRSDVDGISGETVRRNLQFFWLIDWSGSMRGERIQMVNYAIKNVLPEIQKIEDHERVNIFMRAIKFGSHAEWHIGPDPVPVEQFVWKDMDANGGVTGTSQAIRMLLPEMELERIGRRSVPPVIILLSDGACTDREEDYHSAISELNSIPWGKKAVRISIGIGHEGDYDKDQLDAFISPYLRKEQNVETFPASDVRKLCYYIRAVSTAASLAASQASGDQEITKGSPVLLPPIDDSIPGEGPDFDNIDAGDVM